MPRLLSFVWRPLLWVLVGCAYALVVASFLGVAEPPVWSLLALALAIAVVVNTGVGFLNLALFVDVLSHGPADRPAVALTFDDGPHPEHTREVLRELAKAGARATFFLVGRKVDAHPDVVAEIVKAGHEVGLHSYAHDHFLNLRYEPTIVGDLERNQEAIAKLTGRRPMIFRPPIGLTSPRIRVAVKKLGLTVVGWSARAFDGAGRPDPKVVLSRIVPGLEPGAIVLLHDAAERTDARPTSLDALPGLLEEMKARDLRSVTISELVGSARVQASAVPEGAAP